MPFEIPDNWEWCKLGDIVDFQGGYAYKSNTYVNQSDWQVIRIGNVKNDNLVLDTQPVFVEEVIGRETKKYLLQKDDILFTMTGTKGKRDYFYSVKVPSVQKKLLLNQRVGCLRRFSSEVNIDFLCFALKGGYVLDAIFSTETGNVSQGNIGSENTLNLNIAIPPLAEQRRIVSEIERWFSLIDIMENGKQDLQTTIKQAKNKILDLAIHGKLVLQDPNDEPASELLKRINPKAEITCDNAQYGKRPFEIPNSWCWSRLGDINNIARGGSPRPIKDYLTDDKNGINWIKIGDTTREGKYIDSVKEKIRPEGMKKSRFVHKGDFLLTNSMSFGRPYILNVDGCIHDGWLVISPIGEVYTSDFMYHLLSSSFAFEQFTNVASGGVVTNLNSDKVADTIFPVPPLAEQQRIVAKIEKLFEQLDYIENSLEA